MGVFIRLFFLIGEEIIMLRYMPNGGNDDDDETKRITRKIGNGTNIAETHT